MLAASGTVRPETYQCWRGRITKIFHRATDDIIFAPNWGIYFYAYSLQGFWKCVRLTVFCIFKNKITFNVFFAHWMRKHIKKDSHVYIFMTVWKITSKEIVSNIFNALDDDNYIRKKNNIFYGVRTIMFKKNRRQFFSYLGVIFVFQLIPRLFILQL